ncbi:MAG: transcriptional repressor [Anaerolineaceae bacterium]|nr:transcriptional repressor [Anaerolineaceae bacterium]
MTEDRVEILKNELVKKDIRPSYHRIKVLEYLHAHENHPTADEIYAELHSQIPTLSKTTVYNTLNSFVEAGLARAISIDGVERRFDITVIDHGHFRCDRCGAIINFSIDLNALAVHGLEGFQVTGKNVYFSGLCPSCNQLQIQEKE